VKEPDHEQYLRMYPKETGRWMNQCVTCQRKGYKPDLPKTIYPDTALASNLRRYFEPLELNELGLCEQCSEALKQPK
jgi:hypothetical protein